LTRKSTDARDAAASSLHQNQAHLQQDLQARGDRARLTSIECLSAIAALKNEALTGSGFRQLRAERFNFKAGDQGRQPRKIRA
jgi:hypothetical protein